MEVLIAGIGRLKGGDARSPEAQLITRYAGRAGGMARSVGLKGVRIEDRPESRASTIAQRRTEEAETLRQLSQGGHRVALDENGRDRTSAEWAELIAQTRDAGAPSLAFLLGGPDGHDPGFLAECDVRLSLGRATWPHLLARALVTEQVYRALTILAGHPYHRA